MVLNSSINDALGSQLKKKKADPTFWRQTVSILKKYNPKKINRLQLAKMRSSTIEEKITAVKERLGKLAIVEKKLTELNQLNKKVFEKKETPD